MTWPISIVAPCSAGASIGACAGVMLGASGPALAQAPAAPPRQKGPLVWLDMDQQELDDAYDQIKYAPNQRAVVERYATQQRRGRARLGEPLRLAYGASRSRGSMSIRRRKPNAPVKVFIHGGAWRGGLADFAFPAEIFVQRRRPFRRARLHQRRRGRRRPDADGATRCAARSPGSTATPRASAAIPSRIYLSGHSSGGHLAGVVLTTDWDKDFGLPTTWSRARCCCSGMYDLKPVRLSARSNYVKFTDEIEEELSSQRHLDALQLPGDRRLRHLRDARIPAPERATSPPR